VHESNLVKIFLMSSAEEKLEIANETLARWKIGSKSKIESWVEPLITEFRRLNIDNRFELLESSINWRFTFFFVFLRIFKSFLHFKLRSQVSYHLRVPFPHHSHWKSSKTFRICKIFTAYLLCYIRNFNDLSTVAR
jgi:hypothetical protein